MSQIKRNARVEAAALGLGIAFVPAGAAREALARGAVRMVPEDWSPTFPDTAP